MTVDETKKLMVLINVAYPNMKVPDAEAMIKLWHEMLSGYDFGAVKASLKNYIATDTSGFAPSIGSIIRGLGLISKMSRLPEMEAWALVSRALRNSAYHATEEFNKLPAEVQKAVGSAEVLKAWGTDPEYNENVTQSLFVKAYKTVCDRADEVAALPNEVRSLIEQTSQRLIGGSV